MLRYDEKNKNFLQNLDLMLRSKTDPGAEYEESRYTYCDFRISNEEFTQLLGAVEKQNLILSPLWLPGSLGFRVYDVSNRMVDFKRDTESMIKGAQQLTGTYEGLDLAVEDALRKSYVPKPTPVATPVLTFLERQLPEGNSFETLCPVFMTERNCNLAELCGLPEITNSRKSYER